MYMEGRVFIPIERIVARADKRAKVARMDPPTVASLPTKYSLRKYVHEVYDQGAIGSCTANAFCAAYRILEKDKSFIPSRLWVYYYERLAEEPHHDKNKLDDTGADVIDGEKYVQKHGVCSEGLWPYDITKYNCEPPAHCADDAMKHRIKSFAQISYKSIKRFIATGTPVLVAVGIYESFDDQVHGRVKLPNVAEERLLGGHEMCIVGYDDTTKTFEVQNSWGPKWGDAGYCYLPYKYISSNTLCYEITIIQL